MRRAATRGGDGCGTGWRSALLAVAAVLVVLTFRDYGVTWDEDVHNWYGNLVLDYYLSLFADQRALHLRRICTITAPCST